MHVLIEFDYPDTSGFTAPITVTITIIRIIPMLSVKHGRYGFQFYRFCCDAVRKRTPDLPIGHPTADTHDFRNS